MHILNKLFSDVFLITIAPPNPRYSYFTNHCKDAGLEYNLRIAPRHEYFHKVYDGVFEINEREQSLQSAYCSIFYEAFYKNLDSIVIIEDDNQFLENFENSFLDFYNNVPNDWDFLHLSDYPLGYTKTQENHKTLPINQFVDKVIVKHATNCTIIRKSPTYKLFADAVVQTRYPVDLVMSDYPQKGLLNCYSPTTALTKQLSTRDSDVPSDCFKSLLR